MDLSVDMATLHETRLMPHGGSDVADCHGPSSWGWRAASRTRPRMPPMLWGGGIDLVVVGADVRLPSRSLTAAKLAAGIPGAKTGSIEVRGVIAPPTG
jgi:hypothetical protein